MTKFFTSLFWICVVLSTVFYRFVSSWGMFGRFIISITILSTGVMTIIFGATYFMKILKDSPDVFQSFFRSVNIDKQPFDYDELFDFNYSKTDFKSVVIRRLIKVVVLIGFALYSIFCMFLVFAGVWLISLLFKF